MNSPEDENRMMRINLEMAQLEGRRDIVSAILKVPQSLWSDAMRKIVAEDQQRYAGAQSRAGFVQQL
jgi:hypothetical protein